MDNISWWIHRGFKSGCKNSQALPYSEADCKTWEGVEAEWHYLYSEDVVSLWLYPSVMTHAHYQWSSNRESGKETDIKLRKKLNPRSGENPDLAAASMKYQSEKQFYAFIVKHCARTRETVSFYMQMVLSKEIQRKSSWSNFSQESGMLCPVPVTPIGCMKWSPYLLSIAVVVQKM